MFLYLHFSQWWRCPKRKGWKRMGTTEPTPPGADNETKKNVWGWRLRRRRDRRRRKRTGRGRKKKEPGGRIHDTGRQSRENLFQQIILKLTRSVISTTTLLNISFTSQYHSVIICSKQPEFNVQSQAHATIIIGYVGYCTRDTQSITYSHSIKFPIWKKSPDLMNCMHLMK